MSRSTYNNPAAHVAWQKQLRDRYLPEGAPEVDLSLKSSRVREVSRSFAERIILKYEWLGTMASTSLHYGIFFEDMCAGVCCVAKNGSGTAGPTVNERFGIPREGLYTLARGACVHWSPTGANSRLVAWTCKLVSQRPGAKLMIAYSDSEAGEIGTIYQACNWVCTGYTKRPKDGEFVSPKGRCINSQTVGNWARKNGMSYSRYVEILKSRGWRTQTANPKIRWVCLLDKRDKRLARRVEQLSVPYPKRVSPEEGLHLPGEERRCKSDPDAPSKE